MITDALLNFVPPGAPLSCVGATGVDFPSTNTVDELGSGVGTPPANVIGTATVFGSDYGVNGNRPLIEAVVGTAFTTVDAATLNVAIQGAADLGASGGYEPDTWVTYSETGEIAAAELTAGQKIKLDWSPAFPEGTIPRYYRLLFQTPTGTQFTAGTIAFAIVTMVRDEPTNRQAAKNFTVAR